MPAVIALHGAHAGAHQATVRKHHLEPAEVARVQAIGRVADAVIERVADDRAPGVAGHGHPERRLFALQVLVKIEEADARLEHAIAQRGIELQDAVHAAEVEHDRSRHARRIRTVPEVLAARGRPERGLVLIGEAHDGLHLFHAARRERGRSGPLLFRARCVDVRVGIAVLVGREHPALADHALERLQGLPEPRRGQTWRQRQFHGVISGPARSCRGRGRPV